MRYAVRIPGITLTEKVVLITGAGRGAGAIYALACAKAGADVSGFDRDPLDDTAKRIKDETGKEILAVTGDIRNVRDLQRMVEETVEHFGKLDVLVNNAGVCVPSKLIETTEEQWNNTIDVNLKGYFFACKYAAMHMIPRKSGVIINIGSEVSHAGAGGESVYCTSKGGIFIMSQALAIELGAYNIRVVTLCPGAMNTSMNDELFSDPDKLKEVMSKGVLNRINEPEDIAPTLVLLASDAARNVTGCSWLIDFGSLAG